MRMIDIGDYLAKIELEEARLFFLLDMHGCKVPRTYVLNTLHRRAEAGPKTYEQVLDEAIANATAGMPL